MKHRDFSTELDHAECALGALCRRQREALKHAEKAELVRTEHMEGVARETENRKAMEQGRLTVELREMGVELRTRQQWIRELAAASGVSFAPVLLSEDVAGLTGARLHRLAYLLSASGVDEEGWVEPDQWARLVARALAPKSEELDGATYEKWSAVLELAAYLQTTALSLGDARIVASKRLSEMRKMREMEAPEVAASAGRDGWSEETPGGERKNEKMERSRPMEAEGDNARASREERIARGRDCLLPADAFARIREELARLRQLGEEARSNPSAAVKLDDVAQNSEAVIRAAVAAGGASGTLGADQTQGAGKGPSLEAAPCVSEQTRQQEASLSASEIRRIEDEGDESRDRLEHKGKRRISRS